MSLLVPEQLAFATARLVAQHADGTKSVGSSFCFQFECDEGNEPVLLTNKHVVQGAQNLTFHLTRSSGGSSPSPLIGQTVQAAVDATDFIPHPDSSVDLCAVLLAPLLNDADAQSQPIFYRALTSNDILPPEELQDITALEEVIMVGYPIGLWDRVNKMPIFRQGVCATHPYVDYDGKKEFLIDMPCFPGSSGSPVLLYNSRGYQTRAKGFYAAHLRCKLLGVLYAHPKYDAHGRMEMIPVPTTATPVTTIPPDLGVVVKAEEVLNMKETILSTARG